MSKKLPPIRTTSVPCKITSLAGEPNEVRVFELEAYTGEPMNIYPWESPVVIDLDSIDLSSQRVPALYDHCPDVDFVVGQVGSVKVEDGKLKAAGVFTPTNAPPERNYCRKVLDRADAGYQWQVSVGGNPKTIETVQAGQKVTVNGRTYAGPVSVARGLQLREISFVVLGGDRLTSAVVSRSKPYTIQGAAMSFEDWLISMGFDSESQTSMSEVQLANMKKMYADEYGEEEEAATAEPTNAAEETPAEEEPAPTNAAAKPAELQAAATAERARVSEILRLCNEHGNPHLKANGGKVRLASHAVEKGWTTDQVKGELLKVKRNKDAQQKAPNAIVRGSDRSTTLQALQGAMMVRAGIRLDHPALRDSIQARALKMPQWVLAGINDAGRNQIMEASHRYGSLSAPDLCREALRASGKEIPVNREEMIQAAFSGGSLTNIFTTNVNAVLLASYMEAVDTTIGWTSDADVADFKTQERPRVLLGDGLAKLPRGGTADDADFADVSESYKIARYAKKFTVDEQDVIDDSLGALSDTPRRLGQAAQRLRMDLVYSILLSNPTLAATARELFNSTEANLGTSSALSAANLKTAIAAMNNIRENSVNLNLTPTHLIVPPSLRFTAKELVASAAILIAGTPASNAIAERGSMNTLMDENLAIVSDSRLENGVVDPASGTSNSGSATTWFLASNMAHTIEVAYLRGTGRAPRVRSYLLDQGQYGIGWDVSLDIGAKALDWKGLRKTTA